jgi:hypothetical protein
MPTHPPFHEVSVYIEQDGTNKYKIQSNKLEEIGAQLRGRREFSIFHSIVLPLIVSVATIIFSSAFQYISWFNSVGLKNATDVADKAERTYENSAAAIGTRHYAMLVFLPSLRDLIHAKANTAVLRAMAKTNEMKDRGLVRAQANAKKRNSDAERSLAGAMARSNGAKGRGAVQAQADATKRTPDTEHPLISAIAHRTGDDEISLHKSVLDIKQKRFASYYEQLKLWNENYDHQLSDIEYALDRPVFGQVDKNNGDFRINRTKITQIDCSNSLTEELQKQNLNPHSLKIRFAVIHNCFMLINSDLDGQLTEAISKPTPTLDKDTESKIKDKLIALLAMANEFRCYAHQRIDYYNSQKELAIFSFTYVWRLLNDATRTEALKHFEDAASRCAPTRNADFARAAPTS